MWTNWALALPYWVAVDWMRWRAPGTVVFRYSRRLPQSSNGRTGKTGCVRRTCVLLRSSKKNRVTQLGRVMPWFPRASLKCGELISTTQVVTWHAEEKHHSSARSSQLQRDPQLNSCFEFDSSVNESDRRWAFLGSTSAGQAAECWLHVTMAVIQLTSFW